MGAVDTGPLRAYGFPAGTVGDADLERWLSEAFRLNAEVPYVLEQRLGGPCGVVAVVQGLVLAELLFVREVADVGEVTRDQAKDALAIALAEVLWKARAAGEAVVCTGSVKDNQVVSTAVGSEDEARAFVRDNLAEFEGEGGMMLFMYSLMLSRTVDTLKDDMDDATQGLTGQFGHCTQELMNLLTSGVAASQVHDGTVDLGEGMKLRGVPRRPRIGYLTHLEALRYCQVGSFLKKPILPIWVIGSESHYSVLYGRDRSMNEESLRQAALARAKRAFAEQDQQENGFIAVEKVGDVLRALNLNLSEQEIATIIGQCEMQGSGIVLWAIFWQNIKPLMVPKQDWNCPSCTFFNDKDATHCDMCSAQRRDDVVFDEGQDEDNDDPHTYDLVHINGLVSMRQGQRQGPTLTPFKLTTVSRDLQAPSTHGLGEPMEETLHTRWPGSLFLWPNDRAPSING